MESSQLKRLTILGLGILCLSPIEIFSNKLFDKAKSNKKTVVLATADIKLKGNYLSNNYEIFNPNIKTTSKEIKTLVSENKKNEISDKIENNIESENKSENIKEESKKETKKVVEKKVTEKKTVSTNKEKKVTKTTTTKKVTEKKVENQQTNVAPPNKQTATSLVNYAKQFVGNPYKYGGTSLTSGVDCSGFTMKVYEKYGYSLPHSSKSQAKYGTYVSLSNLEPGDLIFYGYNGSISHVAIYIGNSKIVHAATSKQGIRIDNYKTMPIITARRILKNS